MKKNNQEKNKKSSEDFQLTPYTIDDKTQIPILPYMDKELLSTTNNAGKKIVVKYFTNPAQLKNSITHAQQFAEKPHEMINILRVIGHIYLDDYAQASQLYEEIKDRISRQKTIIHNDSKKMTSLCKALYMALCMLMYRKIVFTDYKPHERMRNIIKYFFQITNSHTQIFTATRVSQQIAYMDVQFNEETLQLAQQYFEKIEEDCKIQVSNESNWKDLANASGLFLHINNTLKPIRKAVASLDKANEQFLAKLDAYIEEVPYLRFKAENSKLYLPVECVLRHERSQIEAKKQYLLAEKRFHSLLNELETKRNNLNKVIKLVNNKKQLSEKKAHSVSQTNNRRKHAKKKSGPAHVDPYQLLKNAFQLLQSAKFEEALKLYEEANIIAKSMGDVLCEVQSLLSLAECYDLWFNFHPHEDGHEKKEKAIEIYQQVINYGYSYNRTEIYEIISPYLAFANLALEKLTGQTLSSDTDIVSDISSAKYVDNEEFEEVKKAEDKRPLTGEPLAEPCYRIKHGLPIDAPILSLMEDIPDSYVVGGAIRDLLLHRKPREFDIVTSLTPDELFIHLTQKGYECKIVSYAYPIVLVTLASGQVVEVATFRGAAPQESTYNYTYHPENGTVILNKNYAVHSAVDALNRDTTINAMYYNPRTREIFSYSPEAEQDLKSKTIRMVGDPEKRFSEDPIRMLRVLELSYRLGFSLDKSIIAAIKKCPHYLSFVHPGRLLHQCHKMFYSGHAKQLFDAMVNFNLLPVLVPQLAPYLTNKHSPYYSVLNSLFLEADVYFYQSEPISYPLIFSLLLWPVVLKELSSGKSFAEVANDVLHQQSNTIKILPYMFGSIKNIWQTYLSNNKYFPEQVGNEVGLSDPHQTCLTKRFTRYVEQYTKQLILEGGEKKSPHLAQSIFRVGPGATEMVKAAPRDTAKCRIK